MNPLLLTYGPRVAPVPFQYVGPVDSIDAEYRWIAENVPQGRVEQQSLINHGGRMHDVLRVRTSTGLRDYHFDVTDFYAGPNAYNNQTPCREGHIGTSSCSHGYAQFVYANRDATAPSGDASAMFADSFAAHVPAGHAGAHFPDGRPFTFEQIAAPPVVAYRRKADGATFTVGWQGRCMDGPTQLIPIDGGAAIEVKYPVLERDYDKTIAVQPAGEPSFGALFPPDKAWMIGKTPQEIDASRARHSHDGIDYTPIVESLSAEFLGNYGIVSVGSSVTEHGTSLVVYVNGSGDEARRRMPAYYGGLPVVVRDGGPIEAQGYRPAGDAASDLLVGTLGPLIQNGSMDRVVDRLGNQLIDRFLAQPAVQREVGGAIGSAAVKELSTGVGKPYMQGITIAAGVGAASLLALAVMYAVKK
jgi:hypothetical protein